MKKTRRLSLIAALACALVLVLSLGIVSACGTGESASAGGAWYYGAAVPAGELGQEGDYYLNTKTLASYKKTANGWTAAIDAGEVGEWLYGVGAPGDVESKVGDFYLDTKSGDLYHKGVSGWGEPVLKLFGKNGRDGVLWFSGEGAPSDVNDSIVGDFYLDTLDFEVYQKTGDDAWTDLGSLKGKEGSMQGWYDDYSEKGSWASDKDIEEEINLKEWWTGEGAPYDNPEMNKELETPRDTQIWGLYFDTASGRLWRYDGKSQGLPIWTDLGNVGVGGKVLNIEYRSLHWGKVEYYHNAEKIINLFGNSTGFNDEKYDIGGVEWAHETKMGVNNKFTYSGTSTVHLSSSDHNSSYGTRFLEVYDEETGLWTEQDKDGNKVYTRWTGVRAEYNKFTDPQKSYLTEHDIKEGTPVLATPENTPDGWWRPTMRPEDDYVMGYWIIYEDGTAYFLPLSCKHGEYGETITLVEKDCEQGTIQLKQCGICKDWVYFVTPASQIGSPLLQHRYDTEVWRFDKDSHWHAITCSHKELGNKDVNEHDFFTYATVKWDGVNPVTEPSYEYWKECSVCGYREKVVTKESFTQGDDIVHIKTPSDWNNLAAIINNGEDTTGWQIQLDGDLDFKGGALTPIGIPTNASELVKLDDIGYAYDDGKEIEGGFKGEFDGKNCTIKNFTITGTHFVGLFGCLNGGTVKDLQIEGTLDTSGRYASSSVTIEGDAFVGGVAGFITGTQASITNVTTTNVALIGNRHVGGIAGYAYKAGPAISTGSVNAEDQVAAIKNCVVKGTPASPNSRQLPLWAYLDYADGAQDYYWNGTNLGGILGTAISSSVIKCEVENIFFQGYANVSCFVGYAEGLDTSNRAAVVSNTAYSVGYSSQSYLEKIGNDPAKMVKTEEITKVKAAVKLESGQYKRPDTVGQLLQAGTNVVQNSNEIKTSRAARKNKVAPAAVGEELDISTFEELQDFATRINGTEAFAPESFANSTIRIWENINMSSEVWTPINAFGGLLAGATIDGQGHTLSGMNFAPYDESEEGYHYGCGFISSVTGNFTIQNLTFSGAVVAQNPSVYYGNVTGTVVAYAYGTTTFRNITVDTCRIIGYGKVGGILGMGADPGVHIIFENCKSTNNQIYAVYNAGGFAGNIQRSYQGVDNTEFVGNGNVASGNDFHYPTTAADLNYETIDTTVYFTEGDVDYETDPNAVKVPVKIDALYAGLASQEVEGVTHTYYYAVYAVYYVSYGSTNFATEWAENKYIANCEYCMNTPTTFNLDNLKA